MQGQNKRLRVLAGPNGSGKSTIIDSIRKTYYCGPYVNADEIQKAFDIKKVLNLSASYQLEVTQKSYDQYLATVGASWLKKAAEEGIPINLRFTENNLIINSRAGSTGVYDAAIAADFIRYQLLPKNETFTFETVLSHPSKLDFLQKAMTVGYKNYLYFVCTVNPLINVNRVKQRYDLGGHNVPESKIIADIMIHSSYYPNSFPTHTEHTL